MPACLELGGDIYRALKKETPRHDLGKQNVSSKHTADSRA